MNKNIKYLIEDTIKFNVADYQSKDSELVDINTLNKILEIPKTKNELINLIEQRIRENKFGTHDLCFPDLSDIDVSLIKDMSQLFKALYIKNIPIKLDLSSWHVSNVINMYEMFEGCQSLIELDVSNFDTYNVTNMNSMFLGCKSLKKLDLSSFNTSKVTNMAYMFNQCNSLTDLNVSSFDTSNVVYIYSMFVDCESLKKLDLSNFDTSNVIDMEYMFAGCKSLKELDISNFIIHNNTKTKEMLDNCGQLKHNIKVKKLDKCIDMLTESLQKFNPTDYSDEENDIIDNETINDLTDPINDFLSFLNKYSWRECPIGQLEMRMNSGRNNNKLFFVWKDIYTQINNLMDIYSDVYDSKASNKDMAYVYIKPMDDDYQYGIKTTYVVIIDKNNPNDLNAICFQYVDWGPQHIIGLSYKNKYDIKEHPYLNPNTEYNGILPVEIIIKIKQKFNLQGTLIENLNNFNPADYSDEEDDIINPDIIEKLTDPVNDFLSFLDKFDWESELNYSINAYYESKESINDDFSKILTKINKMQRNFKEVEETEESATIYVNKNSEYDFNLIILTENGGIKITKALGILISDNSRIYIETISSEAIKYQKIRELWIYAGTIYARLINGIKNKYRLK